MGLPMILVRKDARVGQTHGPEPCLPLPTSVVRQKSKKRAYHAPFSSNYLVVANPNNRFSNQREV
jgi:hypothetical protein